MADWAARVDAIFAEWDRDDSPGMALGIVQGGELAYARGYGIANLDLGAPITPATVFHVASVSKQFTALSAALLAEEGKLDLDGDVREHLPELPDLGVTLTPRQFITHTSGLRDQYSLFRLGGWRDDDVQAYDDVWRFALDHQRLNFPPGSEYSYCNTSYTLLATIVERVSGQPFREFVRERLFEPAGMTRSHVHDDITEIVPGRASGYAPREGGGYQRAESNVEAPGAICVYTCVDDLARWVINFGSRAVAGTLLDAALTPGTLSDGSHLRYGYGLALGAYRGLRTVSHGGVDSGYRAEMLWFPEADFGVVILANLSTVKPGALARRVADMCLDGRLAGDELLDTPALALGAEELAAYTGLFRNPHSHLTRLVKLENGALTANAPFGERLPLVPIQPGRFRFGEPAIEIRIEAQADGTRLYREWGSDGRVLTFVEVEVAEPSAALLAEYTGSYVNRDLGVRYSLLLHDGKLVARQKKVADVTLEPTIGDAFRLPHCEVAFTRNNRDQVTGFDVFAERIRYLRFDRE
ncbi:MAG: aminopeptidase [Chloroflexi bacterium]|nr:MAG: aminopeptidase [Chloroflexota bacterium]